MKVNELILEEAIKTLEKGETSFKLNSLEFFLEKKREHISKKGEMPTFFTFKGERWVLFKKTSISD